MNILDWFTHFKFPYSILFLLAAISIKYSVLMDQPSTDYLLKNFPNLMAKLNITSFIGDYYVLIAKNVLAVANLFSISLLVEVKMDYYKYFMATDKFKDLIIF